MKGIEAFIQDPKSLFWEATGELSTDAEMLDAFVKRLKVGGINFDNHDKIYLTRMAEFYINIGEALKEVVSKIN